MKRRIIIILASIIVIFVVSFGVYIVKYQQLVNESSQIMDEHCLTVNPIMIKRKQAYIESIKIIQVNKDLYPETEKKYLEYVKQYLAAETRWIEKQNSFMNRWDFKLFMSRQAKEILLWQFKVELGEHASSIATVKAYEAQDKDEREKFADLITKGTNYSIEAGERLNKALENKNSSPDIKNYFIKVPPSQCPVENLDMPDVEKQLGL